MRPATRGKTATFGNGQVSIYVADAELPPTTSPINVKDITHSAVNAQARIQRTNGLKYRITGNIGRAQRRRGGGLGPEFDREGSAGIQCVGIGHIHIGADRLYQ